METNNDNDKNLEENIETLKKKIEEIEIQKQEFLNGWQRAMADLINYKKEEAERLENFATSVKLRFISKILPILDNFDIVEKNINQKFNQLEQNESKDPQNYKAIIDGFLQIKKQIINILSGEGLERIETIGKDFNPAFHEAVEIIEDKNGKSGTIAEEVQAGYKFKEHIIRPAKVKVIK